MKRLAYAVAILISLVETIEIRSIQLNKLPPQDFTQKITGYWIGYSDAIEDVISFQRLTQEFHRILSNKLPLHKSSSRQALPSIKFPITQTRGEFARFVHVELQLLETLAQTGLPVHMPPICILFLKVSNLTFG